MPRPAASGEMASWSPATIPYPALGRPARAHLGEQAQAVDSISSLVAWGCSDQRFLATAAAGVVVAQEEKYSRVCPTLPSNLAETAELRREPACLLGRGLCAS